MTVKHTSTPSLFVIFRFWFLILPLFNCHSNVKSLRCGGEIPVYLYIRAQCDRPPSACHSAPEENVNGPCWLTNATDTSRWR
ncbi:hypothetical protein DFH11DRAFT_1639404 [Phellopilus nigrolimitatus]|nr:hypothetical protein DFH11DRAFT_1639404 [Phellopilus nigrolimitatus]